MISFFLANKFIRSKRNSNFLSFVSAISIGGIAVGVTIVILAISILNGFESVISDKIISFNSHIKITTFSNRLVENDSSVIRILHAKLGDNIQNIAPFVEKDALIKFGPKSEGVKLIGLSRADLKNLMQKFGVEIKDETSDGVIYVGNKLAEKISAVNNAEVLIASLRNDQLPSFQNPPAVKKYVIDALFESGMAEYDDLFVIMEMSELQKFLNIGELVSGYNIQLNSLNNLDTFTNEIAEALSYPYFVRNLYQLHRNIFTWIELQKEPIPIVLGLIILVAVFNIIGTLLVLVLDRTSDIGILRSVGGNKSLIYKIILGNGLFVTISGILIGNIFSFLLSFVQNETNLIKLPGEIYFLSSVPISIDLGNYLLISIITVALGFLASLIPARIAANITPVNAIKFK
ncbi:MAG: FtsX-like permease family protein [Melioribacteraceae bacterium]|nr:FtsX-like permease family protein [Melioribacteraceae bacterium]MCF8265440.1 FtsX-like permease family protein [Melioribacteraceae bacterium]MCF8431902.1 FtsX-like permease family protein [Melioribacteraceae bacterium]